MLRGADTCGIEHPAGNVLIVDDERDTLESFAQLLRVEGHTVFTADNAEDGLREAESHPPDAVILDLRMPFMDGLAFLRRLRAREARRETPVVIVTGDYFVEARVGADLRALGAEIYYKPLWLEDLVALISRLLAVRETMPPRRDRALPTSMR
jgi:DNA-binding response OmpR family regulator